MMCGNVLKLPKHVFTSGMPTFLASKLSRIIDLGASPCMIEIFPYLIPLLYDLFFMSSLGMVFLFMYATIIESNLHLVYA